MGPEQYSQLADHLRITLRLVNANLQIKEIAHELGIAESTVNHRLAQCRSTLGFHSSRAAARWLVAHEQALGNGSFSTSSFSSMAAATLQPEDGAPNIVGDRHEDEIQGTDPGTDKRSPLPPQTGPSSARFPWPFPTKNRQENDFTWKTRLALVFPVAAFLLVGMLTLIILAIGTQEMLVRFETAIQRLP
jgi:DNA-binding CsgD family transcriptional regulator